MKMLRYSPYLMVYMWALALFAAFALKDASDPAFLFSWAFPAFLALVGGFSTTMALHIHPEVKARHPRLERVTLWMMAFGTLFFWFGLVMHIRQLPA